MSAAPPAVRATDPATSHAAAADTEGRKSVLERVRYILSVNQTGLTDWELWELTGLGMQHKPSVIKRRAECGAIDTGRTRLSPSNHKCIVWTLPTAEVDR